MLRQRNPAPSNPPVSDDKIPSIPKPTAKKSHFRNWLRFIALVLFFVYAVLPALFWYYPAVRRQTVFLNYVSLSRTGNLSQPSSYGLPCAHQMHLSSSEPEIKLGAWFVQPDTAKNTKPCDNTPPPKHLEPKQTVILYLHGNAGTRGGGHRVALYKLLASDRVGLPVVAFDYRGYADSSDVSPTAKGIVKDARAVYDWLNARTDRSNIVVWGHSLGTAVAVSLVAELCRDNACPSGLILEAPFTKVTDAARHYPLTVIHRYLPYFDDIFVKGLAGEDTEMDSEKMIAHIGDTPTVILHAHDDGMVPFHLGQRLHATAQRHGRNVKLIEFAYEKDYGHKGIYKDPGLPKIVKDFIGSLKQ